MSDALTGKMELHWLILQLMCFVGLNTGDRAFWMTRKYHPYVTIGSINSVLECIHKTSQIS